MCGRKNFLKGVYSLGKVKSEYVTDDVMAHVFAALLPANALALRVSDATGLRIGDVLAIKTVDLLRGNRVSVRESKTGKKRVVYIPRALYAAVSAQAGEIWAFEGRKGKYTHRTRQAVWADVKRARAAFRIPAHVTPHSARKLYAVRLMRRYGDLGKVQEKLNHSDVAVTMIYAFADVLTDRALNLRKKFAKSVAVKKR